MSKSGNINKCMSKVEEIHCKAVIAAENQEPPKDYCISAHADHFNGFVEGFVEGYNQAEKDHALTWEDVRDIAKMWIESKTPFGVTGEALSIEVLNRFNKQRGK